ncbi:MAG: FAD-dependent oxidoreductase [Thermoleophilia bacterium]|nr:FAD-dependent oxidoreductase [Thermoleophilia bacterium]
MSGPRILIVGGVAAGMSAALRAKRHNPDADVVVFERGEIISYGACGLPYVLGGEVRAWDDLLARTPPQVRAEGVSVRLRHTVTDVDADAGRITVRDADGGSRTEPYDSLLLATGVAALRPPWMADGLGGLHVLRDVPDGRAIDASLRGARRVAIVGAGYIGLELAEAFRRRDLSVVMVEMAPRVAGRMLDAAMCGVVQAELERNGVDVRTGVAVEGVTQRDGSVTGLRTEAGDVRADAVVVAVGVRPETALARAAGAGLGDTGAVAVDDHQRTSADGVWAAGDNCEVRHRVTGRPAHVPLGLAANRMGRVAGVSMAGGDARFPGIVGTGIFKTFSLGVGRTGLTQTEAEQHGLDAVTADVTAGDHAGYYPDTKPLEIRLTGERGTRRLLGAQIAALNHESAKRIDVVAALLHAGATVDDLADADLAYAPPFAGVFDALLVAAGRLQRALD